jgi:NADH dehydrogenase
MEERVIEPPTITPNTPDAPAAPNPDGPVPADISSGTTEEQPWVKEPPAPKPQEANAPGEVVAGAEKQPATRPMEQRVTDVPAAPAEPPPSEGRPVPADISSGTTEEQPWVKEPPAPKPQEANAPGEVVAGAEKQPALRPFRRPQVVIVGAGFGGLSAARVLAGADVDVLLVDRNNYHGFWPLLYQVATAGLEPESIAYPVRAITRDFPNVDFRLAEVSGVDFAGKHVKTSVGDLPYDYLILAAGSANNYFGNKNLAENTLGMKDIDDAEKLRNHILRQFELAASENDLARRQMLMTIVLVGGGPTGVELAGAISELIRHVLRKDFPSLDLRHARVVLIEHGAEVLSTFSVPLQRAAQRRLEKIGVELRFGYSVERVESSTVFMKEGASIDAGTVIWTAGVRASQVADALGVKQARGARVVVEPTLHVPDRPEVYVVGDMAYLDGYKPDVAYPMVAQVAIQMGEQAAQNVLAQVHGFSQRRFRYFDKGQMATIGRRAAVFEAFGVRATGRIAWFGWLFVHLLYLVGFRNRLIVLTNWVFNYFTYERGVRLITRPDC